MSSDDLGACPELPSTPPSPEPQCSWLCSNQGRDRCATGIHRDRPWCRIVVAAECIEETRVPTAESARAMLGRLTRV